MTTYATPLPLRAPAAARAVVSRLAAGVTGAVLLGAVRLHRPAGLRTICLLRATTGIPCPACGGTTAFVRLGRGRVLGAFAANPFVLLGAVAVVLAPTGVLRPLSRLGPRAHWAVVLGLLAASWLWQLGRFGYL